MIQTQCELLHEVCTNQNELCLPHGAFWGLYHSTQQLVFIFLAVGGQGTGTFVHWGKTQLSRGWGCGEATEVTHAFVSGGLWGFPLLFYGWESQP